MVVKYKHISYHENLNLYDGTSTTKNFLTSSHSSTLNFSVPITVLTTYGALDTYIPYTGPLLSV